MLRRWASKKTAGSTKNGRDSLPKNLGVKKFGGEVRAYDQDGDFIHLKLHSEFLFC